MDSLTEFLVASYNRLPEILTHLFVLDTTPTLHSKNQHLISALRILKGVEVPH